MTKLTEGKHNGEGLLSEANFHRSRENVTIKSGSGVLEAGTILGVVTASGKYAPSPDAEVVGIEGAETAKAVLLNNVDATAADVKVAVIARDAEWRVGALKYDATVNNGAKQATKRTQLAAVGIIAR